MKKRKARARKPKNGIVWKDLGVYLEDYRGIYLDLIPTWPEQKPPIRAWPNEARTLGKRLIQWADWAESRDRNGKARE